MMDFQGFPGDPGSEAIHPVGGLIPFQGGSKIPSSKHSGCKITSYKAVSCKLTGSEGLTRL